MSGQESFSRGGVVSRADRGRRIGEACENARITRDKAAAAVGISIRTLGRITAGQGGSENTLRDLEYYLRLRDERPAGYRGPAPIVLPEPPAPAVELTELSRFTSAQLLAELLRREALKGGAVSYG